MTAPCIQLESVSKKFVLQKQRPFILQDMLKRLVLRRRDTREFWALKDISFSVPRGGSMALIGGNGAGKSTLLSLIIGAAKPTSGTIRVEGRIGALLELGAGFHPDLTGRENVSLNASLQGLSAEEVAEKMESIIAFSELGEFMDVPIRNYSSGMHVRLGFSVAMHIEPEVLIMDEALAVGDARFQKKCIRKIQEFREAGVTFLFVSHGMESVKSLCERAVWLDHGRLMAEGPVGEICDLYQSERPAPAPAAR